MAYNHIGEREIVYLDPRLLKVCIINVIGNALKYSPNEGLVTIFSETISNDLVKFTIKDEGIGIADYDKPYIFDQCFRAKNAEVYHGTGLGLNIVQKFVDIMNGTIDCCSEEKEGSCFILSFHEKEIPDKNEK